MTESATTLEPFLRHIAERKAAGEKVLVVIGGSTSYGPSSERYDTPACLLQRQLPGVRVYNLATDANRPTDDYLVFKAVSAHADYVVVNAYYGWFYFPSQDVRGKHFVAHPEFTFLPNITDDDSARMAAPPHSERKLEYFLDGVVGSVRLYRNRQFAQQALAGDSPEHLPRQLLRYVQCALFSRCNLPRYTPFTRKDAKTQGIILEAPELRNATVAGGESIALYYWKKIASESKGKALFYINPYNPAAGSLDGTNHSENVGRAGRALEAAGARFYDFSELEGLTAGDFTDASHTLDSGNEKIAAAVLEALKESFPELKPTAGVVEKTGGAVDRAAEVPAE